MNKGKKDIDYYALDLSQPELERSLSAVDGAYEHVRCQGLFGTYDDGLAWMKKTANLARPKCILWMGSSIGNLGRTDAGDFLKRFSEVLRGQDSMLIGIDACQESEKVYHAYNDKRGKTHEFVLNGLMHANKIMEKKVFRKEDWKVIGEYDEAAGRHQAFISPVRDVMVEGTLIKAGEKIRVEESYKYSLSQSNELWQHAGLTAQAIFGDKTNKYRELASFIYITLDLPLLSIPTQQSLESLAIHMIVCQVPYLKYFLQPMMDGHLAATAVPGRMTSSSSNTLWDGVRLSMPRA